MGEREDMAVVVETADWLRANCKTGDTRHNETVENTALMLLSQQVYIHVLKRRLHPPPVGATGGE